MGSWNGTCAISQTPILRDEPVAMFILMRNHINDLNGSGPSYSDGLYYPITPAIFGNYDGQGIIKESSIEFILSFAKLNEIMHRRSEHKRTVELMLSYSNNRPKPEKHELPKFENTHSILHNIERNNVDGFGYVLIHRELYDQLIELSGNEQLYYTKGNTLREFLTNEQSEYLDAQAKYDPIDDFAILYRELIGNRYESLLENNLNHFNDLKVYQEIPNLNKELINLLLIKEAFQMSRKLWIPQAGSGSQDVNYDIAKLIGTFATKKKQEYQLNDL